MVYIVYIFNKLYILYCIYCVYPWDVYVFLWEDVRVYRKCKLWEELCSWDVCLCL